MIVIVFAIVLYEVEKGKICYYGEKNCMLPDDVTGTTKGVFAKGQIVSLDALGELNAFNDVFSAFWFAFVTLSNTGYGDIIPVRTGGIVISIILLFVGYIYVAILLGSVVALCRELYQEFEAMKEKEKQKEKDEEKLPEVKEVTEEKELDKSGLLNISVAERLGRLNGVFSRIEQEVATFMSNLQKPALKTMLADRNLQEGDKSSLWLELNEIALATRDLHSVCQEDLYCLAVSHERTLLSTKRNEREARYI